jgi:hypothetical protein
MYEVCAVKKLYQDYVFWPNTFVWSLWHVYVQQQQHTDTYTVYQPSLILILEMCYLDKKPTFVMHLAVIDNQGSCAITKYFQLHIYILEHYRGNYGVMILPPCQYL